MELEAVRLFESSSERGEDSSGPSEMSVRAGSSIDLEVSDTDNREDSSEYGGDELEGDSSGDEDDVHMPLPRPVFLRAALERAAVIKSSPKFLRGALRNVLKFALEEVSFVGDRHDLFEVGNCW